jgi:hypothetical protein
MALDTVSESISDIDLTIESELPISYIDILYRNNRKCYDWFIKKDELKKAKIIEETFNMVSKLSSFNESNSYTLGYMKEFQIEQFFIKKGYKYINTSKEAKSGDFILEHNNVSIIIESKNYTNTVSFVEVEKLLRDMERKNINNAIMISSTEINKIKNKLELMEINGNYIYFIITENQPEDIINGVMEMCINSLSCMKYNHNLLNDSIPTSLKRLSENMSLLYDFKMMLSNTKINFIKEFDKLEKIINIYEYNIRNDINQIEQMCNPIVSSKDSVRDLINTITILPIKNFLLCLLDEYEGELSEGNNSVYFGHVQIELRKRKPLVKYLSKDDILQIRADWEVKNKLVVIPLNNENMDAIKNIILKPDAYRDSKGAYRDSKY